MERWRANGTRLGERPPELRGARAPVRIPAIDCLEAILRSLALSGRSSYIANQDDDLRSSLPSAKGQSVSPKTERP